MRKPFPSARAIFVINQVFSFSNLQHCNHNPCSCCLCLTKAPIWQTVSYEIVPWGILTNPVTAPNVHLHLYLPDNLHHLSGTIQRGGHLSVIWRWKDSCTSDYDTIRRTNTKPYTTLEICNCRSECDSNINKYKFIKTEFTDSSDDHRRPPVMNTADSWRNMTWIPVIIW